MIWGGVRPAVIFLVMFTCRIALCQDIDTVIFEHGYRKTFTILDQIEDPGERKAFQSFIDETSPAKRRALAEKFISNYPQSRFLAHAYDVASRASADLEDLEASLDHGARSLKLLPENPLLLVSLANVQVHRGMLDQAESSATLALEYFDRFRRPARYTEQQWAELEPRLRASCHYVLGRVAVARAIPAKGAQKHALTRRAQESLLRSRDLYDQDAAAAYLLGLTTLALGDKQEAANHFADAHRLGGPMAGAALKQLETIGMNPRPFRKPASRATGPKPVPAVARYSGSESCKGCHGKIYESWRKTGMARMFRPYEPGNVLGDFASNNVFRSPAVGPPLAKAVLDNGRHFFEFPVEGGQWRRYPVDYTIGSKWQQAYATRLDSGRIHVFPIQYNLERRQWLNFWEIIDPPGSERTNVQAFPEMRDATSYQKHCAPCHTSQLRAGGKDIRPENFTFQEPGINCEMCHGPSAAHIARTKEPDLPVRFREIDHKDYVAICSQCHLQSGFLALGPNGEANYSGDTRFYTNRLSSLPYPELSVKAFYKDGRFRETTFIVESFLRSACFRKGGAHCGHCHNPHPEDPLANPKSLKFIDQPDQMCLQCHQSKATDIQAHTRHPAASEASRCASCHMPKIMNSLMFKAGTHQIDDLPDAQMTLRFGPDESPNACLECHQELDAKWAAKELSMWPGWGTKEPRATR